MILKQLLFLMMMLSLPNASAAGELYVIDCGSSTINLSRRSFPLGIPLSVREICSCSRRNWRGTQCDIKFKNKVLRREIARKNNLIADEILGRRNLP